MKSLVYLSIFSLLVFFSCKKDNEDSYPTYAVQVQLTDTLGNNFTAISGVNVKLTANTGNVYNATSNASGVAAFKVPEGIYQVSATLTSTDGAQRLVYNGNNTADITVTNNWSVTDVVKVELIQAQLSQVIIKEIYNGGVPMDNGSGVFKYDGYIVLYNNSDVVATLNNLCIGTISPANATTQSGNKYYVDGKLLYTDEKWLPSLNGFWYFQNDITIQPGQQIVVAIYQAINHTLTYSKSVNLDNSKYYTMYDIASGFAFANYYVAPAASIPSANYLKGFRLGTSTVWPVSFASPGIFLFQTKGVTPLAFGSDVSTNHILGTSVGTTSKKVPTSWVLDGVEAFEFNNSFNYKRFLSTIDAGQVSHSNNYGYSIYRNVDKAATEAIAANAGKLVYNYSLEANNTSEPSHIDAEASIKNGARIVYMDNNNSSKDFHIRSKASLRTN